jgi:hypothetical protein
LFAGKRRPQRLTNVVKVQAMTDMKKSIIIPHPEDSGTASIPNLVFALTARDTMGQGDDPCEKDERQPIAISKRNLTSPPNGRRKATRYQFNSAAIIRWLGVDEQLHQAFGVVRDISTSGVFVESMAPLCLNANVELEIAAPSMQHSSSGPELQFEGKVLRAVNHKGQQGFAIAGYLYIPRLTDLDGCPRGS